MAKPRTTSRLEARISPERHVMLKRAAYLQGKTMKDFVVATVQDAARRAIGEAEIFRLTVSDQETFACALLSPPPPTPAMERAFARHRALLHTE